MEKECRLVSDKLRSEFSSLKNDATKYQWMLAATSILLKDDVSASTVLLPFIEHHSAAVLKMVFSLVEDQTELCVVALRFLASVFTSTCCWENSQFHVAFCASPADYIPVLVGLGKTNDPSLSPFLLMTLSSLACGPCANRFSVLFAVHGDADAIRLIMKFLSIADRRSTAMDVLSGFMNVKEGIRLCRKYSSAISEAVLGTQLEYQWKLVNKL
ncbi:Hypothetical protein, putative [Bodo saltans]|uniref:Uncharacterized protein n=1 Tax=Bodo saltans TaxID=75058 RepID=A0A0S4J088_BODSA|nr:Hypothetical protein, putative [Bodo saltans]|eukprot:CUF96120.1 Hypothetical protein, putative [Bodo saltans]